MKTYRVFGVKKWVVTVDAENEEEAKMICGLIPSHNTVTDSMLNRN